MSLHASEFRQQSGALQHDNVFAPVLQHAPPSVEKALRSPGQALDAQTRAFAESRFGHDFSNVRVHTDTAAAVSAQAVNARAYTVGPNIVFGPNQYAPQTTSGQKLLLHELAHVLQQRNALTASSLTIDLDSPHSVSEKEAQTMAQQAFNSGYAPAVPLALSVPKISRQIADEDVERRQVTGQRSSDPLPYREALEATGRGAFDEYARDCAGMSDRTLQRLQRTPSPATDMDRLERRIRRLPIMFEKRAAINAQIKQYPSEAKYQVQLYEFDRNQIEPEFGPGYLLGTLEQELAKARCQLSQARWEFMKQRRH